MPNRQFHISALSISLDAGSVKNEAQVLPAADFEANGKKFVINAQVAQQLIADFASKKNDTLIDYEHQMLLSKENGKPAPAAGWFNQLEWRNDGLYATNVSWTAAATEFLEKKEYRYTSAVFLYDVVTGEIHKFINFCLTNDPAVDGMESLAALSMDQLSTLGDLTMSTSELAALTSQVTTLQTQLAAEKDKVTALTTEKAALTTDLTAAQKRADDLETEKKQAAEAAEKKQHGDLLQTALTDGKLIPAQEEWAKGLSLQALTDYLAAAPVVEDGKRQSARKEDKKGEHGLTEDQLAMCSQMQLSPDEFAKTLADDKKVASA